MNMSAQPTRDRRSAFFGHTITTHRQVNNISNPNVDYSEETLVLLLELLLVENLDRENAVLVDPPAAIKSR